VSVESISNVLNYSRASGTDKVVLIGIANHDGDGGSWPSIATLARYANVDARTVQRSIKHLVEMGEIVVHDQQGGTQHTRPDRRPNRYEITVPKRGDVLVTPLGARGDTGDVHGVTSMTPRGDAHVTRTVLEPSTEPTTTALARPSRASTTDDRLFEEFWITYPRKVGKRNAKAAYVRARRRGFMHTDILDGAQRYRDDPNRENQFTAHPTTWLNRDGWQDEPLPARNGRHVSAQSAYDRAMTLAESFGDRTQQIGAGS